MTVSQTWSMFRITAIAKENDMDPNPYTAISHLRWRDTETGYTGIITRVEAYDFLVRHPWCLYIQDESGARSYLMPAVTDWGVYHVRTVSQDSDEDEIDADALLSLPEFL
jgi:hypothetical protein